MTWDTVSYTHLKDGCVYLRDGLYTETIVCVTYIDGLPVHQADAESE